MGRPKGSKNRKRFNFDDDDNDQPVSANDIPESKDDIDLGPDATLPAERTTLPQEPLKVPTPTPDTNLEGSSLKTALNAFVKDESAIQCYSWEMRPSREYFLRTNAIGLIHIMVEKHGKYNDDWNHTVVERLGDLADRLGVVD